MIPLLLLLAAITPPQQATKIVVKKSDHTMTLYHGQTKLQSYNISLGSTPGPKQQAGDRKTPEGSYVIDAKNPDSKFHRAFHLSYPNTADRQRAQKPHQNPGGDIEIHGQMKSLTWLGSMARNIDWTAGCIALTNDEVHAIWPIVPVGTPVEIEP